MLKKQAKRICHLLLALLMVISLTPIYALDIQSSGKQCTHIRRHTVECTTNTALPHNPGESESYACCECGICKVQMLVDALAEVESISEENAENIGTQLSAIDDAKADLEEWERAQVNFLYYNAAISALLELEGLPSANQPELLASGVSGEVIIDGLTYSFTFTDGEALTACLNDISNPTSPEEVTIPQKVTYGGKEYTVTGIQMPFSFSSSDRRPNITGLTLPNSITSVNNSCFGKFTGITEISIPGSVKNFDGYFQGCAALKRLVFEEGVEQITSTSMLVYNIGALTSIVLPSTLKKVTTPAAFSQATGLTDINLPEGIEFTESSAFSNCTSLKSITLPASFTEIPSSMFSGCTALETVTAKGRLTSIGSYAFKGCTALANIPSLSRVTTMGESAFENCTLLKASVDLSSLSVIPKKAFAYARINVSALCSGLTSIGEWAFIACNVSNVSFPQTLESIGGYAFFYSTLSNVVVIPDSVTSIGGAAFNGAYNIKEFHVGSGLTNIPANVFSAANTPAIIVDNSADEVYFTGGTPANTTFLQASIGAVGDTISNEAGALTLQQAVDAAAPGEVITIEKHIKLSQRLNIPAGKDITITAPDQSGYTIMANDALSTKLANLMIVQEGAAIKIGGDVTLSGKYNTSQMIINNGALTLMESADIRQGSTNAALQGIINVSGSKASFTMTGGCIEKNIITDGYSGTIRVSNGAKVDIKGGTIKSNRVDGADTYTSSPGILLFGASVGSMTGGTIIGNTGYRGSAIMLYSTDESKTAEFTLNENAEISGNESASFGAVDNSGAVHIEGRAEFSMKGGVIAANKAEIGAGVCVADPGLQTMPTPLRTTFTMTGGKILNNTAGRAGGGIYSFSDYVTLSAGRIAGNVSGNLGGGIYSEGNETSYSTVHIKNALISNNTADSQGGGMWLCPTGSGKMYIKNGGTINGNTAGEAGDDMVALSRGENEPYTITLTNRAQGGEIISWYQDGKIGRPNPFYSQADPTAPRYGEMGANTAPLTFANSADNIALKSVVSQETINLAESKATLFITGNSAYYGGGIGANGGVEIGEDVPLKSINVRSMWRHLSNPEAARPQSATIQLKNGGRLIETLILNADCNWEGTFADLPITDGSTGDAIVYTVEEIAVANYSTVTEQQSDNVIFTNTYITGGLAVNNTVTGNNADLSKAFTFTVTLSDTAFSGKYGDMEFVNGRAVFSLRNGESKIAAELPVGIGYTVTENDNQGYAVTSENTSGTIIADKIAVAAFINRLDKATVTNPDTPPAAGGDEHSTDNTPATGDDTAPVWVFIATLVLSAGAIFAVLQIWLKKSKIK